MDDEKRLDFEARVTAMQRDSVTMRAHVRRFTIPTVVNAVLFLLAYGFGAAPEVALRAAVGGWALVAVTMWVFTAGLLIVAALALAIVRPAGER